MGYYIIYCRLCGNPSRQPELLFYNEIDPANIQKYKLLYQQTKWYKKCIFLHKDNTIIKNCKIMDQYIYKDGRTFEAGVDGEFVHMNCWTMVLKKYNIRLKYGDIPPHIFPEMKITKYQGQDFDFKQLINDNMQKLCVPNINIFPKFKIKSGRSGPSCSAQFFKNGDYKIGENGNIWVIKNNKWVECTTLITSRTNKNVKLIGEVNNVPKFAISDKLMKIAA